MPSGNLDTKKLDRYQKLFAKLSWRILECKFLYYEGPKHNLPCPPDSEYDMLEDKYLKLAKILKRKPVAQEMVGFNHDKPSCKMVAMYMIQTKGKSKIEFKFKKKGK